MLAKIINKIFAKIFTFFFVSLTNRFFFTIQRSFSFYRTYSEYNQQETCVELSKTSGFGRHSRLSKKEDEKNTLMRLNYSPKKKKNAKTIIAAKTNKITTDPLNFTFRK